MTREVVGLVALDLGLLACGEALLAGLGLVRSPRSALRHAPLALAAGWAATGLAASLALIAGLQPTVPSLVVLWGLLAGAAVVAALRVPAAPARPARRETAHAGRLAAGGGGLLLLLAVVELCRRALASGPLDPDVWAFWLPKAKTIVAFGGLDTHVGGFTSFPHADYPPLAPTMEAATFRFLGQVDPLLLPIQHWVVAVAVLGAVATLLSPRVRPAVLWPSLALLSFLPDFEHLVGSLLGDEPLTELVLLGGICAALWLLDPEPRHAALAGLFLAAATMAKNEGLMLSAVLVLLLGVLVRGHLRTIALLAAAPLVSLGAWKLWLSANSVQVNDADYRFHDAFDPSYLGDRAGRLWTAFTDLPGTAFDPGLALLALPLALALALVLLVAGRERRLALFAAGTVVLSYAGFLAVYWIGLPEIHFYLDSSATRILTSLTVLSAALFPLLLSAGLERARR